MIRKSDINRFRLNHFIGQKITVSKTVSPERIERVEATIIGIYPHVALVSYKMQRWCIRWADLMREGQ